MIPLLESLCMRAAWLDERNENSRVGGRFRKNERKSDLLANTQDNRRNCRLILMSGPLTDEQAEASSIRSLPVRFRQVRHCWPAPPYGHCLSLQNCRRFSGGLFTVTATRKEHLVITKKGSLKWFKSSKHNKRGFCGKRLQPVWSFRSVAVRLHFCGIAQ